jgi:zinc-finger of transposase IS204/IS1001/IS1096/IS1165
MVTSTNPVACCPVCQSASRQVHCYYTRTVTDLCWADFQVQMKLHVRRFVCPNVMCPRRTFAERLGEPIKAYARRTKRCTSRLQTVGLMLGGNAGALLAKRMGLPVSADTLLFNTAVLRVKRHTWRMNARWPGSHYSLKRLPLTLRQNRFSFHSYSMPYVRSARRAGRSAAWACAMRDYRRIVAL